ncbi:ribonucleotide reductase assembly protein NrdI (plasmid) [Salipiger sp. CCB-MM3]|uniref:class Ib ribonucleoside-diphosphate reductase assembly flavoprotein NrdI n=1 Tax=Salipiger sp. CCB-MM3 TaxID=1792508 RepID=UPI00080AA6E7|nr:class Ib ribonucleoside-diphosphate reductase assembly flavoprotein NrdI [Salipiger sp. CCB-MM3]ANT62865.1 ribonucleotide reductase assembly protein NrdI [Salipiger sp. CCB-MM3]
MSEIVYFSSRSENTHRFVQRLGRKAMRIPRLPAEDLPEIFEPYVLFTPTFADGEGRHAVPRQVIRFLNDLERRRLLRGVIASGNRNFGETFAIAGNVVAQKCQVPLLYCFELAGTDRDVARVNEGLNEFWKS